jgi:3-mercaptopyruvate sulfurtransferase SseA
MYLKITNMQFAQFGLYCRITEYASVNFVAISTSAYIYNGSWAIYIYRERESLFSKGNMRV